jgi:putative endonuclease
VKLPCVYILASKRNGTLYIGVTNDLVRRVWEHKSDVVEGFTKKYGVHLLAYAEFHATMPAAILREKQMKRWRRQWKLDLIERDNPEWRDLYAGFAAQEAAPGPSLSRG